jgi:excisionase family DNA binding protein
VTIKWSASTQEALGPLLDYEAAAAYLAISERFLRLLVSQRRITYVPVGRLRRFSLADLEAFIAAGREPRRQP